MSTAFSQEWDNVELLSDKAGAGAGEGAGGPGAGGPGGPGGPGSEFEVGKPSDIDLEKLAGGSLLGDDPLGTKGTWVVLADETSWLRPP